MRVSRITGFTLVAAVMTATLLPPTAIAGPLVYRHDVKEATYAAVQVSNAAGERAFMDVVALRFTDGSGRFTARLCRSETDCIDYEDVLEQCQPWHDSLNPCEYAHYEPSTGEVHADISGLGRVDFEVAAIDGPAIEFDHTDTQCRSFISFVENFSSGDETWTKSAVMGSGGTIGLWRATSGYGGIDGLNVTVVWLKP